MESSPAEGGQQLTWEVCETDWQAKVVKSALCAESAKYKLLKPVQTSDPPPKHVRCLQKPGVLVNHVSVEPPGQRVHRGNPSQAHSPAVCLL